MRKQQRDRGLPDHRGPAGLTEDVRGRQRRYVISMSIRTVSVILAVVLWNVERRWPDRAGARAWCCRTSRW